MRFPVVHRIFSKIGHFFATVPGSLRNHLNTEELARITIAALTAGGGVFGLLQSMMSHAGSIFPAPSDAAMATLILTTMMEAHRRLNQGEAVAPPPRPLSTP